FRAAAQIGVRCACLDAPGAALAEILAVRIVNRQSRIALTSSGRRALVSRQLKPDSASQQIHPRKGSNQARSGVKAIVTEHSILVVGRRLRPAGRQQSDKAMEFRTKDDHVDGEGTQLWRSVRAKVIAVGPLKILRRISKQNSSEVEEALEQFVA